MTNLERILKKIFKSVGALVIIGDIYLSASNPKEYAIESIALSAVIGYAFYNLSKNKNNRNEK